jgi:hypothetical protein
MNSLDALAAAAPHLMFQSSRLASSKISAFVELPRPAVARHRSARDAAPAINK